MTRCRRDVSPATKNAHAHSPSEHPGSFKLSNGKESRLPPTYPPTYPLPSPIPSRVSPLVELPPGALRLLPVGDDAAAPCPSEACENMEDSVVLNVSMNCPFHLLSEIAVSPLSPTNWKGKEQM